MSKSSKTDSNQSRGGRLARRARSFKDDFLGRLNQMRSPAGTRAASPSKTTKSKVKVPPETREESPSNRPGKEIDTILRSVRLLSTDLRYFQDVVEKNILEMLPGSATVVLETVLTIHSVLRESLVNEQSSLMLSASNQVYQTLANLIRWSDNILLYGEKAAEKENVGEIVQSVHDAVKSLVQLSLDRLQHKDSRNSNEFTVQQGLSSSKPESPHRSSLPDIPLTPREREILEQTKITDSSIMSQLHHSASSDSILGSSSIIRVSEVVEPPPKPPLPAFRDRIAADNNSSFEDSLLSCNFHLDSAPPLPPKRKVNANVISSEQSRIFPVNEFSTLCGSCGSINTEFNSLCTIDWTSPCSQSPENLTPISKSSASSLDSNLNNSVDDLSYTKFKYLKCSEAQDFTYTKQHFLPGYSSQTYNCELSSYSATLTTTTTSISLQSNDVQESAQDLVTSMNEISVTNSEVTYRVSSTQGEPPALPVKLRKLRNNTLSQYDNMPQLLVSDLDLESDGHSPQCPHVHSPQSWIGSNHVPMCRYHQLSGEENGKPPPLPPKEKTIKAYMQMFGSYSQPSESEFLRHSVHTYKVVQANWQQIELSLMHQQSYNSSCVVNSEESSLYDGYNMHINSSKGIKEVTSSHPPSIPPKKNRVINNAQTYSKHSENSLLSPSSQLAVGLPEENTPAVAYGQKVEEKTFLPLSDSSAEAVTDNQGALDELDPTEYLIMKKSGEEGPDLRGGSVDSLIVHATRASKNDFLYQEAFLTTYRTFISPFDLICKLLYRYNKFIHVADMRQRAARNAFALLVRVVDDLCLTDVNEEVLKILMDFIAQLVSRGDLLLARALRKKVVEKCDLKQRSLLNVPVLLSSMAVTTHKASLLDFKSESIAEQMTVLDADLFQKIEIPEVLLWAKEQKEELSPNLTTFTEHFNKMSYWARSRILEQEEAKDRERYVVKFIKVMKYLRKLNNFNSYLAILSALDSAPIRRLEWQRNITEGLKEYCALIDSSSSFRAYRQALAETGPPCIPYIGLILQDLTFVHIGNSDILTEDTVNFSKRWQQFNILENMRRFKNCQYPIKRNEQIISFFNNFDDYLCEEAMWQISETIKPRGGKKKSCDQS
ncbi:LOW QUALITY PROTEIN: rap guanine nucleotide exchange factor 1-like [Uloborus diversus]|uniref:LOW QUALITY PROTEIN: rap guanine nucleotide exchange factor 1-like n=1 Tax=Uloborus diversus TaxID=327109 RepID=UPI002409E210|nr:LOW QUALITY PROTEIN: rap guanine nucleotide exchange factor 1-like [Uloborus diversus]